MKNNSFCILPFIHLSTRTIGAMQLCCHANSSTGPDYRQPGLNRKDNGEFVYVDKDKPSDYWNTEYMKSVRKKMMKGEYPKECRVCYREEASGYRSKRQWENEDWSKVIDFDEVLSKVNEDGVAPFNIHYADMKLGNKCDLACLMCNPADSSLWIPDYKKIMNSDISELTKEKLEWKKDQGKLNWYKLDSVFWEDIESKLDTMQSFYIIGGEPTINTEFKSFLEMCVESGYSSRINLRFNTNGYTTTKELDRLYTCFKTCLIHLSLDGLGDYHNLIRYPSSWETMLEKLDYWDNTPDNMQVGIDLTASVLNVFHIPDFVKWKLQQNFNKINNKANQGMVGIHYLHSPDILSVTALPKHLKEQVVKKYEELFQWIRETYSEGNEMLEKYTKFQALLNFMNSRDDSDMWPRTIEYLNKMDEIRKTNWRKVLKEYV
jgi:MoaA/NifB/PqqE/SkfB family radical SAM enzyme